jgi:diguanylate cyclase (GGDEF)-like protein/PAS domain S-box-containing protein
MIWQFTPYSFLYFSAALISLATAWLAWQRRSVTGASVMALMLLMAAEFAFCVGMEGTLVAQDAKILWTKLDYIGYTSVPVLLFIFTLIYTQQNKRWLKLGSTIPWIPVAAILMLAWTNEAHHLIWSGFMPGPHGTNKLIYLRGPAWYWSIAYVYLVAMVAWSMLCSAVLRWKSLYRRQAIWLLASASVPILAGILYIFSPKTLSSLEFTPLTFAIAGCLITWNLIRHKLFDLVPVAYQAVFEYVGEGILFIDAKGRIAEINPTAQGLLGVTRSVIGAPAQSLIIGGALAELETEGSSLETSIDHEPPVVLELRRYPLNNKVKNQKDSNCEDGWLVIMLNITARKQAEEKLRDLSLVDDLTSLYNRRGFFTLATQQMKIADRLKQNLTLIYADLDKLKVINDTLGHKEGDRALVDTASIMKSIFRASDIVARIGGDEFIGLALDPSETTDDAIQNRLMENLNTHNLQEIRPYRLSITIGTTRYNPEKPCSLDELIEQADKRMYEHKQNKILEKEEQFGYFLIR